MMTDIWKQLHQMTNMKQHTNHLQTSSNTCCQVNHGEWHMMIMLRRIKLSRALFPGVWEKHWESKRHFQRCIFVRGSLKNGYSNSCVSDADLMLCNLSFNWKFLFLQWIRLVMSWSSLPQMAANLEQKSSRFAERFLVLVGVHHLGFQQQRPQIGNNTITLTHSNRDRKSKMVCTTMYSILWVAQWWRERRKLKREKKVVDETDLSPHQQHWTFFVFKEWNTVCAQIVVSGSSPCTADTTHFVLPLVNLSFF